MRAYKQTMSQHNIFDSEKLSQFFHVFLTGFEPQVFESRESDALRIDSPQIITTKRVGSGFAAIAVNWRDNFHNSETAH